MRETEREKLKVLVTSVLQPDHKELTPLQPAPTSVAEWTRKLLKNKWRCMSYKSKCFPLNPAKWQLRLVFISAKQKLFV